MRSAERVFVPLKTMCSMKWLMPPCSGRSCRLPCFTQTPTATLRSAGIVSVISVRPLSRISLVIICLGGRRRTGAGEQD